MEDGQLTIENGFFRMLSGNRNYPERFLQMSGGLAVVRTTKVEGVDSPFPLIDLLPSAGHAPPQLLIDRSLLAGYRSVIRHGAAESVLELRQSILSSSTGVTVSWDAGSGGSTTLVNHSTLAGNKSVFQVLPLGANTPVELFSEGAVYSGASMIELGTDASAVQWWGRQNGYSGDMKTFLVSSASSGPQDFQATWVQGWGAVTNSIHSMEPTPFCSRRSPRHPSTRSRNRSRCTRTALRRRPDWEPPHRRSAPSEPLLSPLCPSPEHRL